MSRLIKRAEGAYAEIDDRFTFVADDEAIPAGDVIVSLSRFQAEGETLASATRLVGVRLEPDQTIEDLAYDLPRIPVIELRFAKFRDGRPYTAARLLRERFGYAAEVRAVGDVLREQAQFMVRCGFDAFVPADGSTAAQWGASADRFRHVYQRAADDRTPAYEERTSGGGHGL